MATGRHLDLHASSSTARWASILFILFCLWTALVSLGVGYGPRRAVWREQVFGEWPAKFGSVTGAHNSHFSIYASLQNETQGGGGSNVVGNREVGEAIDPGDSGY